MKDSGKSKTPIIAAHSKKNNGHKPAPSAAEKNNGKKVRVSRVPNGVTKKVKSLVLDRISDGIVAFDSAMNYVYLNERAGEILGREPESLMGKNFWREYPQATSLPFADACQRAFETKTVMPFEGHFPTADNWFEGRVYPSEEGLSVLIRDEIRSKPNGTEAALAKSEEKFSKAFHLNPSPTAIIRIRDQHFFDVNQSLLNMLGYQREEMIERTFADLGMSISAEQEQTLTQLWMEHGSISDEVVELQLRSGELRHLLVAAETIDLAGESCILILASDISEREQAENRIPDISRFPEQNPDPIMRFTRDGTVLYANPTAEKLLASWRAGLGQALPTQVQELLPVVLDSKSNREIELENEGRIYLGLLVPIPDSGYINLYCRDITERRQAKESLRALIQQTTAGITRTDLTGRFTFVNQAFCDMLGYSEAEMIGRTIWEISYAADIAKNKNLFERMIRDGEPFQLEKRIIRRNGSLLWITVGTSPLHDAAGKIWAASSIIVDITRRKRAEESLLDGARRTLYISSLSDAIRPLSDPSQIQMEAARSLGAFLRANRVAYAEITADGTVHVHNHYVDGIPDIPSEHNLDKYIPDEFLSNFRAGRAVVITDVEKGSGYSEQIKASFETASIRSQLVIPIVRNEQLVAALFVQQSQPREWKNEDIHLVEETAERIQVGIERARTEVHLRESEERLRLASQAAKMCTWELNVKEQTYKLGDNFEEVLGFSPDLLPKNSNDVREMLNVPEDLQAIREVLMQSIQTRSDVPPLQYRVVNPETKEMIWLEINATLTYDAEGKPHRMFGMVQNIGARKAVEDERIQLLEREQAQRLSAEQSQLEAGQAKAKAENELTERKLAEAALGAWVDKPLPQEARPAWMRYGMALLATGVAILLRLVLDPLVGDAVQFTSLFGALAFSVWYAGLGPALFSAIVGYLGISWLLLDWQHIINLDATGVISLGVFLFSSVLIMALGNAMRRAQRHAHQSARVAVERQRQAEIRLVEQKRVEEALRESERKFSLIYNNLPFAATLSRPENGVLVDVNQEFERAFGYGKQEAIGSTSLELGVHPKADGHKRTLDAPQQNDLARNMEIELFTKPKGTRVFLANRDIVTIGEEMFILQTMQDITERKRAEQALSEFARQEEALYKLSDQLHRTNTLGDIFNASLDAITNAIQSDRASILLFDAQDVMQFVAWRGLSEEYRKATTGHSPWKREDKNPLPVYFNDIDSAELSDSLKEVVKKEGIGSLAFIPLVSNGNLIGKFMVYFNTPRTFSEGELDLSLTIARQLAAAIDRKRADDELRASEALYRTIARSIPGGGVYVVDNDFRYIVAEGPITEAFGLTREMLEGHTVSEVFPEETAARMEARLQQNFAGETVSYETQHGERVYWTQQAPVVDSFGHVIIVTLDITERKQAEERLRASEEKYRRIVETANEGIWEIDKDTRTVFVNQRMAEMLGYTPEEMLGRTVFEFMLPETYEEGQRRLERAKHGVTARAAEFCYRRKDNSILWTVASNTTKLDEQGNFIGAFAMMSDITERKLAEEALRQSEERFAQFMQHLPGLAWIKDVEGRYVYANAAAEKAFNTPREKLYGKTDQDIFAPEVATQFKRNDERALKDGKGVQVIEELEQEDGVLHYSLVTKFPIPGTDGKTALIGGTAFDITERIQIEEALRQAREHAEETANRMARLQEVTALLGASAPPAQLAELILEQGTRATGAAASLLVELINDGKELKTIAALGYPAEALRAEPVPLSEPTPMSDSIQSRQAIWLRSQDEFAAQYPSLAKSRKSFGNEATVALPLVLGDRVLGGLVFSFTEQREFFLEERGFLLAVAQQCAQGLDRARAEEALRESEERYRAIVNQATAGIVRKDARGKLLFVNDAFSEMLGYSISELTEKTMWQLTHKEDVKENKWLFNRLMVEGTPFQLEKRLIRRDGSILWATVSVSPVLDASGKPQSAVSVYADITERKQAEQALQESRERYRNLFNFIPVAVYTCDANGLIKEFNRSAAELWGREPLTNDPSEKYCGSFKIYYPDGRFMPHRKCPMARILAGETLQPHELEILVERRDGSRRIVIAHPMRLKNEHGEIIGAINCLYDMTDRKQAEKRLALLANVSELARNLEDPNELMLTVSQVVGEHFNARRCLFNEIDLENDREIVHSDYRDNVDSVAGIHKLSDYSSITSAEMAAGKTVVNFDSKTDPRTAADYERSYLQNGERAYVAVPLMRDNRWVASLWISDDEPRQWSKEDVSLLQTIADRTWTATEKLRIHTALRENQQQLALTYEHAPIGIVETSLTGSYTRVNEEFCQILGYEKEDVLQHNIRDITYEEDVHIDMELYQQLIASEIPFYRIEKRYVKKDGSLVWTQVVRSVIRDGFGRALYSIGAIFDLTERKRAEEQLRQWNAELEERVERRTAQLQAANEFLRESEATSRLILESMPDAIVIADKDGRIVHCNAQVETLFGYSQNEVHGKPVETLIPERFQEKHVEYRNSFNKERYKRIMGLGRELFGHRKDDSEFPVDVMLSPISNNTTWDVMVTIRDNTEQRRAQEALRTNEEKLRTLFEILPVGISFLDSEGRIMEMNPALTQILGVSKSELLLKSRRYIRSDGSPMPREERADIRAHTEQKTIYNVETGIVKDSGETIWTSVNAAPMHVADVDVVVATINTTERKKAEEALHNHRERLKTLSRRLVEVQEDERRAIARELHDRVGQNLAALNLNLNILRSQLTGTALLQVGTRLNDSVNLVNQILTITRNVMSDLRSNVLDDYGLEAALREYADQFTQRTGLRIFTETPSRPIPRLPSGIEMTLLRIAQEALTNVSRHAQARQATISIHADDDIVHMSIQDDGIGILSWQKANQVGSHGLRIIRERAEAFGGSLQVHSAYKKGTRIEVQIPLGQSSQRKIS